MINVKTAPVKNGNGYPKYSNAQHMSKLAYNKSLLPTANVAGAPSAAAEFNR